VRKLLSISIVLALLVTFVVPVAVAAQDTWEEECCGYTPPEAAPLPDRNTKTLAGGVMWTLLGASDIMGQAVCAMTSMMELGVIGVDITAAALDGIAGLVEYAFDAFLGMADLGTSIADLLKGIAEVLAGAAE
jgi:phosphoglycerate dehydrogenase-like enzyme